MNEKRFVSRRASLRSLGAAGAVIVFGTAKLVGELTNRFRAQHRLLNCRELLGCDLSTPEGRQAAKEKNLYATVCNGFVRDAAKILNALLNEAQ
jgi:hypothetical protein